MIEVVVSDWGGVLTNPLSEGFAVVREHFGIPVDALNGAMVEVGARRGGDFPLHLLERGELDEETFFADLSEAVSERVGQPVDLSTFSEVYFGGLETNHAVVDELRTLRERGYRLALLTNNVREWEPRWRPMLPVDELFEHVVDSAVVGTRKPEPEIYRLTTERLGVAPEACVLLDDFEHNCAGALAHGWRAVRFADTEQALADLRALLAEHGVHG